jgi:hypothetical protein
MPITKASGNAVAPAAKGDLVVGSATNDASILSVGSNDQVLTADSSTATGLKWATPSGYAWTSAASGSLPTGVGTVTISSLSGKSFIVIVNGMTVSVSSALRMRFNGDTGTNYYSGGDSQNGYIPIYNQSLTATRYFSVTIPMADTSASLKDAMVGTSNGTAAEFGGVWNSTSAITSITLLLNTGNFTGGTYQIWKVV